MLVSEHRPPWVGCCPPCGNRPARGDRAHRIGLPLCVIGALIPLFDRAPPLPAPVADAARPRQGDLAFRWTLADLAAVLLTETDLPVARTGDRVGRPDPNYASRQFTAFFGATPTAHRAAYHHPSR